jgi:hypothetical protein
MIKGYTVFFSYVLETNSGYGYSTAIHCNYINSLYLDSITNKEVNIYFNNVDDFKYLSNNINGGTGYTVNKIYLLIQLINNSTYTNLNTIKPVANEWRKYEVTDQIIDYFSGYTTGESLTPTYLCGSIFKVPIYKYNTMSIYNLDYLNYPSITQAELKGVDAPLCFGDEQYFIGNVSADAEAIAYTTDLAISLPLNQYNSTTNPTWDHLSEVYITEIGLYDSTKKLVAIGKLNDPVPKNSTISRTIVFGLDF